MQIELKVDTNESNFACAEILELSNQRISWSIKKKAYKIDFSPSELHLCHTERERIKIDDILKAKNVLVALNEVLSYERG